MNMNEYQLEHLRARFAARGYQPLNRRRQPLRRNRLSIQHWIGYGLIGAALTVIGLVAGLLITI